MRRFSGRDSSACRVHLSINREWVSEWERRREISVRRQDSEGPVNGLWSMDAGSRGPTLNWSTRTPSHLSQLSVEYSPLSSKTKRLLQEIKSQDRFSACQNCRNCYLFSLDIFPRISLGLHMAEYLNLSSADRHELRIVCSSSSFCI